MRDDNIIINNIVHTFLAKMSNMHDSSISIILAAGSRLYVDFINNSFELSIKAKHPSSSYYYYYYYYFDLLEIYQVHILGRSSYTSF